MRVLNMLHISAQVSQLSFILKRAYYLYANKIVRPDKCIAQNAFKYLTSNQYTFFVVMGYPDNQRENHAWRTRASISRLEGIRRWRNMVIDF